MEEQNKLAIPLDAVVIQALRNKLKTFLPHEQAYEIRCVIREHAIKNYTPKYSDREKLEFLERHEISVRENHSQSENHPYIYTMFSVLTQHIMGDTVSELLDKAIDIEKARLV